MNIDLRENEILQSSYKAYGSDIEHYCAILTHLSTYFNDSIIVDLGTLYGNSAAALAYNKSNKVYTYDIEHRAEASEKFESEEFKNIEYIIGNCIENNWQGTVTSQAYALAQNRIIPFKTDREIFLSSKLIFLDVDPHDGIQEAAVLNFLVENDWKGIMVCDDIGQQHPPMREWWNNIELPKCEIINRYSSGSGTGIICFDNQKVTYTSLSQEVTAYKKKKSRFDPAGWPHSKPKDIVRFDDGTFKTNDGITGTWNVIRKADDEEVVVIKTWAGSLEIPITK